MIVDFVFVALWNWYLLFFFITNFYLWISLFFFNKKLQKLIYSSADGLDAFASFGKLPNDPFKTYNNTYIILINAGSCNEVTVVQYTSLPWHTHMNIWHFSQFYSIQSLMECLSLDSLKNFDWELWPKQILAAFALCTENEESKPFCHVESRDFLIFSRQAMNVTLM